MEVGPEEMAFPEIGILGREVRIVPIVDDDEPILAGAMIRDPLPDLRPAFTGQVGGDPDPARYAVLRESLSQAGHPGGVEPVARREHDVAVERTHDPPEVPEVTAGVVRSALAAGEHAGDVEEEKRSHAICGAAVGGPASGLEDTVFPRRRG